MKPVSLLLVAVLLFLEGAVMAFSEDQFPERMMRVVECLRAHGLKQGSVVDVSRGDAHFATYIRTSSLGIPVPSIKYNGGFVEGKTNLSPDIIKICDPNSTLTKNN